MPTKVHKSFHVIEEDLVIIASIIEIRGVSTEGKVNDGAARVSCSSVVVFEILGDARMHYTVLSSLKVQAWRAGCIHKVIVWANEFRAACDTQIYRMTVCRIKRDQSLDS